jgi:glycosyltransferase involved in cell wall biosynthesis/peptidoglycan/xylan/chitin deacetylase (PgdA/CDA1 family)
LDVDPAGNAPSIPRLTVVVPTYQRCSIVLATLQALERQDTEDPFEVVVVVDGSTDGTAQALRGREWAFPIHVLQQSNRGAASARNVGAANGRADIILFLDDDMEATPGLLRVHLDAYAAEADAVVGATKLHPASPRTILSEDVGRWGAALAERCSRPGYQLGPDDIFTGQLSVRREVFDRLDGFDTRFTQGGAFGNEDVDFAHRLIANGCRVLFRLHAVTYQRFVVTAADHLRRWEEVGEADVALARLHPDLHPSLRGSSLREPPRSFLARLVVRSPDLIRKLVAPLRRLAIAVVDRGIRDPLTKRVFARLHALAYWSGVARAGGPLDSLEARVLCWHALADLSDDPILQPYGVAPESFRQQLRTLQRARWSAIAPGEFVSFLEEGRSLPRRAFLVTFDDCYRDLASEGAKILSEAGIGAAAFAITALVGGTNRWDASLGRRSLPLAEWSELQALEDGGVEIGSHSRTHVMLSRLDDQTLADEVIGSQRDLVNHGFVASRLFAYPYGDWDGRVRDAVRRAGYRCAFTVDPGVASSRTDPLAVPRIEITPGDRGPRLLRKVSLGGSFPLLWLDGSARRVHLRISAKRLLAISRRAERRVQ